MARIVGVNSTFEEQRIIINEIAADVEALQLGGGGGSGDWSTDIEGIHTLSSVGIGTTTANANYTLEVNGPALIHGMNVSSGEGARETALGPNALANRFDSTDNVAIGPNALLLLTSGIRNAALGVNALTTGTGVEFSDNVGVGNESLRDCIDAGNTAVGNFSLQTTSTGYLNVSLGYQSGNLNETGANNIFLGSNNGIATASNYRYIIGSGSTAGAFDGPNFNDYQLAIGYNIGAGSEYWLVGDENLNIGLGTTIPTSKLTVEGDGSFSGVVTATRFESSSTGTPTIDSPNNLDINALEVGISTDLRVGRDAYVGVDTSSGLILTSPNGTEYRLVVDDSGILSTVLVP